MECRQQTDRPYSAEVARTATKVTKPCLYQCFSNLFAGGLFVASKNYHGSSHSCWRK